MALPSKEDTTAEAKRGKPISSAVWLAVGVAAGCWLLTAATSRADDSPAAFSDPPAYSDVGREAYYYNYVQSLARAGVFDGTDCDGEQFCPGRQLKRWQLAVWLMRSLGQTDPPATAESGFADVAADDWWAPYVDQMAELGITEGCQTEPARYCPDGDVTRGQMASFLARAFDLPAAEPAGFADVADDNPHRDNIDRLAAAEITTGCQAEPQQYCPGKAVTKAQMAAFIFRGLDWLQQNSIAESSPVRSDIFLTDYNQLSHFIKTEIVNRYRQQEPWLEAAWNRTNRSQFRYLFSHQLEHEFQICHYACALILSPYILAEAPNAAEVELLPELIGDLDLETLLNSDQLSHPLALSLMVGPGGWESRDDHGIYIHELSHIYTLADGVVADPLPLAAAHLYFSELTWASLPDNTFGLSLWGVFCAPMELYADAIQAVGPQPPGDPGLQASYWQNCSQLPDQPTEEAKQVARAALDGRLPTWFDDRFRNDSGQLDYRAIWFEVMTIDDVAGLGRPVVANQLRQAFGGFCSEQQIHRLLLDQIDPAEVLPAEVLQPWVDGDCQAGNDDNLRRQTDVDLIALAIKLFAAGGNGLPTDISQISDLDQSLTYYQTDKINPAWAWRPGWPAGRIIDFSRVDSPTPNDRAGGRLMVHSPEQATETLMIFDSAGCDQSGAGLIAADSGQLAIIYRLDGEDSQRCLEV